MINKISIYIHIDKFPCDDSLSQEIVDFVTNLHNNPKTEDCTIKIYYTDLTEIKQKHLDKS